MKNLKEQITRMNEIMGEKDNSSLEVYEFQNYTLILSNDPCEIFTYLNVDELHGLSYEDCLSYDNTTKDAYIAGLSNIIPGTEKKFLFLNKSRLGNCKQKMGLIMHETMHLSLELHNHNIMEMEEEIISWAEEEAYKIFDLI
jgi:hypothetical protein